MAVGEKAHMHPEEKTNESMGPIDMHCLERWIVSFSDEEEQTEEQTAYHVAIYQ